MTPSAPAHEPQEPRIQDLDVGDFIKNLESGNLHVVLSSRTTHSEISDTPIPLPLDPSDTKGIHLRDTALELVDEILDIRFKIETLMEGNANLKLGRSAAEPISSIPIKRITRLRNSAFLKISELRNLLGSYSAPHQTIEDRYRDSLLHFKSLTPKEAEEAARRVTKSEERTARRMKAMTESKNRPVEEICSKVYFHPRLQILSALNKEAWDIITERPKNSNTSLELLGIPPDDAIIAPDETTTQPNL